jgi:hypothetical protein
MRLADPLLRTSLLACGLMHFDAAEPDHAQAVHWFEQATAAGDAEGEAMLGLCLLEGLGVPRDAERAREHLERAAARGSANGGFQLGRMLVAGWGGLADAQRGVALYLAAAARGHADAAFNLANCLQAGWGCLPDRLAAKALFLRARSLGSPLRPQGLRVRARELTAVRALARRFEDGRVLARLIEERQHEIHLLQHVLHGPPQRPPVARAQRPRKLRLADVTTLAVGVTLTLFSLAHLRWRLPWRAGDAGPTGTPTSIA